MGQYNSDEPLWQGPSAGLISGRRRLWALVAAFAIVGGCCLAAEVAPAQAQTAAIAPFDDTEAQLRLRQAANAVGTAASEVEELRKGLEAERKRVATTNEERELNQETIKTLEKNLKSAEARLRERETALTAVQEERRRGLAAQSETRKIEEVQRQEAEEERRRQEAALNPPQAKPAPPPPPPDEPQLSLLERQKVQVALAAQSFDPGLPDGQFGPRTRQMIAAWQRANNQLATGYITKAQYQSLVQASAAAIGRFEQDQKRQNQPPAPPPPQPRPQPPPIAGPGGGDPYHVTNNCRHPVRMLLRYKDSTKDWTTQGWWAFTPSEAAYLAVNDQRLLSRNSIWYFYAETTDGSRQVWEGDQPVSYQGRTYKMKKKVDEVGANKLTLTCTGG